MRNTRALLLGTLLLAGCSQWALRATVAGLAAGFAAAAGSKTSPSEAPVTTTGVETRRSFESQIDGDFNGWAGETVVKLTNGQSWQQVEFAYLYVYSFRPKVTVYRDGSTYKMKVDGVNQAIRVKLLF